MEFEAVHSRPWKVMEIRKISLDHEKAWNFRTSPNCRFLADGWKVKKCNKRQFWGHGIGKKVMKKSRNFIFSVSVWTVGFTLLFTYENDYMRFCSGRNKVAAKTRWPCLWDGRRWGSVLVGAPPLACKHAFLFGVFLRTSVLISDQQIREVRASGELEMRKVDFVLNLPESS